MMSDIFEKLIRSEQTEKKTELFQCKLTPSQMREVKRAAKDRGVKHTEFGRVALAFAVSIQNKAKRK